MRRTSGLAGLGAAILLIAGWVNIESTTAAEAATSQGAAIGEPAPAWENLEGTDGERHSLRELEEEKAVAVVFTCNSCPIAVDYEERLKQLVEDYVDKGVTLVAINVNNNERDRLPAMKERAEEQGFNFAYLYDPSQQTARDYGATVTPHVFLLGRDRKVVYMGAIDDSRNPQNVTEHYLRDAIDAVLTGEEPGVAETKQFGCAIQYE